MSHEERIVPYLRGYKSGISETRRDSADEWSKVFQ